MTPRRPCEPVTLLALAALSGAAAGCAAQPETAGPSTRAELTPPSAGERLARRIESAHGLAAWRTKQSVTAGIEIRFGGRVVLGGSMIYDHHGNRVRLELDDGAVLGFDGRRAWVAPASADVPRPRFHLLTWPYFLAAPFKLRDPGAELTAYGPRELEGRGHDTALLTFEPGVGDSPDDWYVVYEQPDTHRLAAMAYIVTYGGTAVEEAEEDPHMIVYGGYERIGGVVLSTRWLFYHWSAESGRGAGPIGEATLTDVRFGQPPDGAFRKPAGAREAPLP